MYIFQSPCSKNDKIKKRIAQLKEELTTINRQSIRSLPHKQPCRRAQKEGKRQS
ncbi:hypothetical protein Bho11B_001210 [Bartonella sp. 11B]|nr:hypothetical protein Bho11B_001210 [Bartonella sp. 11B]AQX24568.1 hypothetical protein Bho114_012580 [Bartonella sp. 114]